MYHLGGFFFTQTIYLPQFGSPSNLRLDPCSESASEPLAPSPFLQTLRAYYA